MADAPDNPLAPRTRPPYYAGAPIEFAGYVDDFDRTICAMEFSLDDGASWTAYPTAAVDKSRGVNWRFVYTPEAPGRYLLKVRPVTEDGEPSALVAGFAFEALPAGGLEGRTRAMLKVEDGCVNFCTYCIIPYARGPVRSLPMAEAEAEAKRLAEEGYREIVLTGIEISSWGQDLRDGTGLIDLVEAVCAAAPGARVRLGSLEPRTITGEFCRRAARLPNLCPHFHLSMQSGCDATLKRMNRKYDTARYYESVRLLRESFARPAITTDLIVGFPGETEEEFTDTLAFVERCAFSSMHIFPYSRRPGTPAAGMSGQIPRAEQEARAGRAGLLAARLEGEYLAGWVGATLPVLFEEETDGCWRGHAPNYVEVRAPAAENLHNVLGNVVITGVQDTRLMGVLES